MLVAALLLLVLFLVALAIALRVFLRPRSQAPAPIAGWAQTAGEEFGNLSEAERCDLVFAVAALDDTDSQELLERALDDPSETVALAAARALARLGRTATLERYFAGRPGERARRIARTLDLLP
jgi:hypothetical protein